MAFSGYIAIEGPIGVGKTTLAEQLTKQFKERAKDIIAIEKEKFVPSVKLALELALALDTPIGKMFRLENEEGRSS